MCVCVRVLCRGMYFVVDRMAVDDFMHNLQTEWLV